MVLVRALLISYFPRGDCAEPIDIYFSLNQKWSLIFNFAATTQKIRAL
jgi:hypothetical protein